MAYTLKELLKNSATVRTGQIQCTQCRVDLCDNLSGCRWTKDGPYCADCYFDEISKIFDEHPVGTKCFT